MGPGLLNRVKMYATEWGNKHGSRVIQE